MHFYSQVIGSERGKAGMEKISRYSLVFITVIVLSIGLPKLFWIFFEKPVKKPFIQYSCVNHDFLIYRSNEKIWEDTKGNQYSRDEYEQKLPLFFFKQLYISGTLPDSINHVPIDLKELAREKSFFHLRQGEIDAPVPDLFPLFESRSGRAMLEWPEDFFRITWRIEFIDAASNKILEEKSQMFSASLYHNGFVFPAKLISGITSQKKSCDEGYFIVDSKNQLFHLKMVIGKPYIRKIEIPYGLIIRHISCVDFKNKAFYAYLLSDKNEIYILSQNEYKLVKWPIEGYDSATSDLKIYGDMLNYTIVIEGYNYLKVIALDKKYQFIDSYSEKWDVKEDLKYGKIFASIFPAQVSMTSENSKYVRFYFSISRGFNWFLLNLALLAIHFALLYWRKKQLRNHFIDLGIIAICGIYGFLAIHFFRNKFYE